LAVSVFECQHSSFADDHHPVDRGTSLSNRHPEDSVPTYQYACTECAHRFEAVQAFTDDSLTDCPVCGGQLRKVYGSVGVVFKGSGFYRTDSRAAATSTAPANGAGEKSAGGDTPSEKSGGEKKPDKAAASTGDSAGSAGGSKDASPAGKGSPSKSSTGGGGSAAGKAAS
jgi:putative FmdB family regulatory protein